MIKRFARWFSLGSIMRKAEPLGECPKGKDVYLTLYRIIFPALIELVFASVVSTVDMIMVGVVGTGAIAAVGITSQPRMIVLAVFLSMNAGVTSIVARSKGEGSMTNINTCVTQALILVVTCSVLFLSAGFILARPMLAFVGAGEDIIVDSVAYFRILMCGLFFQLITLCLTAAQRGLGRTRISMRISLITNIVNVIFNWLLIGGNWGFPALGVSGAALATAIGYFAGTCVALVSSYRTPEFYFFHKLKCWKPDKNMIKRLTHFAGNAMMENISLRIGFLMFAKIVASQGTLAFATHQICSQVLDLSFTVGEAHAIAATALVGQNLGMKRPDLSKLYAGATQRLSASISAGVFLLFFFSGSFFMSLFTTDAQVIRMGINIMKLCAVIQFFQIYRVVLSGVLRGAGDMRFLAWQSLIGVAILRPLLAYLLVYVLDFGLVGAWYATLIDQILRSGATRWRYGTGKWTSKKV